MTTMKGQELWDRYFIHRGEGEEDAWEFDPLYDEVMPRRIAKFIGIPVKFYENAGDVGDMRGINYKKAEYKALEIFYNQVTRRIQKFIKNKTS